MQSSLRVPKYKACIVRMQRQLHESRKVATMSMDLSISSSEGEGEGYWCDDAGDRSAGDVAGGNVTFSIEAEEQESDIHHADGGDCLGRDRNIDGEVRSVSWCDEGSCGYSLDGSRDCDHRAVGDIAGSNAALQYGESFDEAQEPEEGSEAEGGGGLAIQRERNAESVGVQVEETAPVEAAPSSERGRAKEGDGRSGRRRRGKGRSNGKGRDASRDTDRHGGGKECRRGLRAATPPPSRQHRGAREPPVPSGKGEGRDASRDIGRRDDGKVRRRGLRAATLPNSEELQPSPSRQRRTAQEPPAPSFEESVGPIPSSLPGYYDTDANKGAYYVPFGGGHNDEVSVLSSISKPIAVPTENASFNSKVTLSTTNSEFNEMQSNGDGEQEIPKEDDQNPIGDRALKINPNEYDTKGRCVRHPQVRLRKKKVLGGWKVLLCACPACCVEELYRIQLGKNNNERSSRQQQKSQDCRPLLGRAASQNSFQSTAIINIEDSKVSIENTASLTASSRGSNYQHDADKEWAARHKEKKSNSKGKDRQNSSRPQEQPKTQNKSVYAASMHYTDEDNRQGIYNGQINASFMPHGLGTLVYLHDGSRSEGEWEDGRYRPQSTLTLNSGARSRSGQRKSERSRSASRDKRHRRRPACSSKYCH